MSVSKAPQTGNNMEDTPKSPDNSGFEEKAETARKVSEYKVNKTLDNLGLNNRAQTSGNQMLNRGINLAVTVLVVGLLVAYLLPIAISELTSVDTSAWGSAEAQLFELLPLFFVLAIVLWVINKAT